MIDNTTCTDKSKNHVVGSVVCLDSDVICEVGDPQCGRNEGGKGNERRDKVDEWDSEENWMIQWLVSDRRSLISLSSEISPDTSKAIPITWQLCKEIPMWLQC
jgi:hypothetical protein